MDAGVPSLAVFDAIIFSFLAIAVITTGLRLWNPGCLFKTLQLDDILAVAATVRLIALTISKMLAHAD